MIAVNSRGHNCAPFARRRCLTITFSGAPSTMRYILYKNRAVTIWRSGMMSASTQVAIQDTPGVDLYQENVPITLTFSASKEPRSTRRMMPAA